MYQHSKRNTCSACGKACVGRDYCRSCYTDPEKKNAKQDTPSQKKDYCVYCLYTEVEGVFYVGCGQSPSRLHATIKECKQKYSAKCMKCRYIHACAARKIAIHTWVVCQCQTKQSAEEIEYALIQMYPSALTNDALNWNPLTRLPAFLQGVQEEKVQGGKRERLLDARRDLLVGNVESAQVESQPERIRRAVDAIIAFNDATEQRFRWYINENVICELLGGLSSHETRYCVRRYLVSHHEDLEVHHHRYGLKESNNRKVLSVHERVNVEPPVAYEPYPQRFRRVVDAILAYNDTVSDPSLRWYINADVVHTLTGGWASGLYGHLAAKYLAGRHAELEAHHRTYGLTKNDNQKPGGFWSSIRITERVKVEAEFSREPYTERIRRAVNAIMAYNEATEEHTQRWYISMSVVYGLLGGSSSGMATYPIERYLANQRDELNEHHHKHGVTRQQSRKLLYITECVRMDSSAVHGIDFLSRKMVP